MEVVKTEPEQQKGPAAEERADSAEPAVPGPPFPSGLRVLVVDDDPLCLKVVGHMLRRCDYEGEQACVALSQCAYTWFLIATGSTG